MPVVLETTITIQTLINIACGFMGVWGFWKVIKEVKHDSDSEHERRQGWDNAAKVIKEKEAKWDKGLADIYEERRAIIERFDIKLADLEDKIEMLQARNDEKNKELKDEIKLIIRSLKSIMDGLMEQGYEDAVSDAKEAVDDFLTNKV